MEMKRELSANGRRKFCFNKIEWKIKNYYAAISKEKWVISSPVFVVKGNYSTRWRLSLKCNNTDEDNTVSVYVEMLECKPQKDSLWVSWKFVFSCAEDDELSFDVEFGFDEKKSSGVVINDSDMLESILQGSSSDTLTIRCLMFMYDRENSMYGRSKDLGLRSLSQDFRVLYNIKNIYDIKLFVGGFPVKVHRAMLHFRNEVLKTLFESGSYVINLPDLDLEATKQVFGYLYTGNLDYVLRKPSLSVLNCIKYFGIKELEIYYEPEELTVYTEFQVEKCSFTWVIPYDEIADVDITLNSLVMEKYLGDNGFRLYLYPKSYSGNAEYMSIFIETIKWCLSGNLYLELNVIDSTGNETFSRKICFDPCVNVGFQGIFPREILQDVSLTNGGNLQIVCNFRMPIAGSEILSEIQNKVLSNVCVEPEPHYEMLSSQISSLFESGIYSDFILKCEEKSFEVHSCILSARSHVFRNIFKRTKYPRNIRFLELYGMRSNVLKALLYYMYSGKIMRYEVDDILDIYRAAERFCILSLKYRCSSILQANIGILNVRNVLSLAERSKDYKLKTSLYKFICSRASENLPEIADLHIKN